jgi:hypothetical protein
VGTFWEHLGKHIENVGNAVKILCEHVWFTTLFAAFSGKFLGTFKSSKSSKLPSLLKGRHPGLLGCMQHHLIGIKQSLANNFQHPIFS